MKLLVKISSHYGINYVLPDTINDINQNIWIRLNTLLKDYKYCGYINEIDGKLSCTIFINYDICKLIKIIPELNREWINLTYINIINTQQLNSDEYSIIIDVDNDYLLTSGYFRAILEDIESSGKIIPLSTVFDMDTYNYVFGKLDKIPKNKYQYIEQYYTAVNYYDLRFNEFIEELQQIIDNVSDFPHRDFIIGILQIKLKHKNLIKLEKFVDIIMDKYPEKLQMICVDFLENNIYLKKIWYYHLITYKNILINTNNIDYLLFDFFKEDIKQESITKSYDNFIKQYNKLTYGIIRSNFNWKNKVIAGGFILECIFNGKLNNNTDIDFFLYGTVEERKNAIIDIIKHVAMENKIYIGYDGCVIYIWINDIARHINIINGNYKNMSSIIEEFDHSCCKVLYNGKSVLCYDDFINSMQTKETTISNYNFKPHRLYKMIQKGFTYKFKDQDEEKLYTEFIKSDNPTIINNKYYYPTSKVSVERNYYLLKCIYNLKNKILDNLDEFINLFDFTTSINKYNNNSFLVDPIIIQNTNIANKYIINIGSSNNPESKYMYKLTITIDKLPYLSRYPHFNESLNGDSIKINCKLIHHTLINAIEKFDKHNIKINDKSLKYKFKKSSIIKPINKYKDNDDKSDKYMKIKFNKIRYNGVVITNYEYFNKLDREKKYTINFNIVPYLTMPNIYNDIYMCLMSMYYDIYSISDF